MTFDRSNFGQALKLSKCQHYHLNIFNIGGMAIYQHPVHALPAAKQVAGGVYELIILNHRPRVHTLGSE